MCIRDRRNIARLPFDASGTTTKCPEDNHEVRSRRQIRHPASGHGVGVPSGPGPNPLTQPNSGGVFVGPGPLALRSPGGFPRAPPGACRVPLGPRGPRKWWH
eukprot:7681727-Pyramimonas_sp.AAC.1